ncbi:hypothetical protein [Vibrio vulnificus]|uniref:hypothetical protein n=1 Tax=Vibrio vulnificus TaxID=672 RepID=UPI00359488F8
MRKFGQIMVPKLDGYVKHFYDWLRNTPEYEQYFGDERKLQRVKNVEVIGQKAFAKGLELIFDLPRETPLSLVGYPMR